MLNTDSNYELSVGGVIIMVYFPRNLMFVFLFLVNSPALAGDSSYGYVCASPSDLELTSNGDIASLNRLKNQGTLDQMTRIYIASGFTGNTSCALGWYNKLVGLISNCVYPNLVCDNNTQTLSRLTVLGGIANNSSSAENANSSIGSVFTQLYNQYLKTTGE